MKDLITELDSKVKDSNNTTTIFDTRKYVLLDDAKELLKQALSIGSVSVCAIKPPLGLTPRRFTDEKRLNEVQGALVRYYDANKAIPLDWIIEYNELVERLH